MDTGRDAAIYKIFRATKQTNRRARVQQIPRFVLPLRRLGSSRHELQIANTPTRRAEGKASKAKLRRHWRVSIPHYIDFGEDRTGASRSWSCHRVTVQGARLARTFSKRGDFPTPRIHPASPSGFKLQTPAQKAKQEPAKLRRARRGASPSRNGIVSGQNRTGASRSWSCRRAALQRARPTRIQQAGNG